MSVLVGNSEDRCSCVEAYIRIACSRQTTACYLVLGINKHSQNVQSDNINLVFKLLHGVYVHVLSSFLLMVVITIMHVPVYVNFNSKPIYIACCIHLLVCWEPPDDIKRQRNSHSISLHH